MFTQNFIIFKSLLFIWSHLGYAWYIPCVLQIFLFSYFGDILLIGLWILRIHSFFYCAWMIFLGLLVCLCVLAHNVLYFRFSTYSIWCADLSALLRNKESERSEDCFILFSKLQSFDEMSFSSLLLLVLRELNLQVLN